MQPKKSYYRSNIFKAVLVFLAIAHIPILLLLIAAKVNFPDRTDELHVLCWLSAMVSFWMFATILRDTKREWRRRELWDEWFCPMINHFIEMKAAKGQVAIISVP